MRPDILFYRSSNVSSRIVSNSNFTASMWTEKIYYLTRFPTSGSELWPIDLWTWFYGFIKIKTEYGVRWIKKYPKTKMNDVHVDVENLKKSRWKPNWTLSTCVYSEPKLISKKQTGSKRYIVQNEHTKFTRRHIHTWIRVHRHPDSGRALDWKTWTHRRNRYRLSYNGLNGKY